MSILFENSNVTRDEMFRNKCAKNVTDSFLA